MAVIYTLSFCGRLTLDLHDLNNEGTEGNQQMTRMVWVVIRDTEGKPVLRNVNAISGDMFKHIQAEHLHRIALDWHKRDAQAFPLSTGAKLFDANRINLPADVLSMVQDALKETDLKASDKKGLKNLLKKLENAAKADGPSDQEDSDDEQTPKEKEGKGTIPNARLLDQLLRSCGVTDLMGTLITSGGLSLPRKSCMEFGWVVGQPELTRTDSLFHVKYDPRGRGEGAGVEDNRGQAIFHRPVNSGVYAVVGHAELYRIGRNDITLEYAIDPNSRKVRARALLESLWYTFVKTSGAQRNTQHPHIVGVEGALTYSTNVAVPAPTASSLDDSYLDQLQGTAKSLNRLHEGAIVVERFKDQQELANVMAGVIEELQVPDSKGN